MSADPHDITPPRGGLAFTAIAHCTRCRELVGQTWTVSATQFRANGRRVGFDATTFVCDPCAHAEAAS